MSVDVDRESSGLFIVFEGPEGSGKSTQVRMLADRLMNAGLDVLTTREPGGTDLGERLRALMMRERSLPKIEPRVQTLLMLAARAQHLHERIQPWLDGGGVVICDRYAASTLAYQGGGFGLDGESLEDLNAFATQGVAPDLTLLLDLDVETGLRRSIMSRGTDWEKAGGINAQRLEFHERVRRNYLMQAKAGAWPVLDATQSEGCVGTDVWRTVEPKVRGCHLRTAGGTVQACLPIETA